MRIAVKVSAKSKQNKIVKISTTEYKVYVSTAPERGKANEKVAELLSEYFGVSKSSVKILRGENTNKKLVEIIGKL
jgi:hypothetical protein